MATDSRYHTIYVGASVVCAIWMTGGLIVALENMFSSQLLGPHGSAWYFWLGLLPPLVAFGAWCKQYLVIARGKIHVSYSVHAVVFHVACFVLHLFTSMSVSIWNSSFDSSQAQLRSDVQATVAGWQLQSTVSTSFQAKYVELLIQSTEHLMEWVSGAIMWKLIMSTYAVASVLLVSVFLHAVGHHYRLWDMLRDKYAVVGSENGR